MASGIWKYLNKDKTYRSNSDNSSQQSISAGTNQSSNRSNSSSRQQGGIWNYLDQDKSFKGNEPAWTPQTKKATYSQSNRQSSTNSGTNTPASSDYSSNKVNDLVKWSRQVRGSDMSNIGELAKQAQDFQEYFKKNQGKYDARTLGTVKNLLQNGQNILGMNGEQAMRQNQRQMQNQTFNRLQPSQNIPTYDPIEEQQRQNANVQYAQQADERYRQATEQVTGGMNGAERADYIQRLKQQQARLKPEVDQVRDINEARRMGDTKAVQAVEDYNDATQRLEGLRAQNEELKRLQRVRDYSQVTNNPDFAENSRYRTTVRDWEPTTMEKIQRWMPGQSSEDTSFDMDEEYERVNRNKEYTQKLSQSRIEQQAQATGGMFDDTELMHVEDAMDDSERAIYNYLYRTQGKQAASSYLNDLKPDLNKRYAEMQAEGIEQIRQENPVVGDIVLSAVSVLDKPVVGPRALATQLGTAALGGQIDPYDPAYTYNRMNTQARQVTGQDISDAVGGGTKGEVANLGYQTVMSMLDNLYGIGLGGGGAEAESFVLGIMGTDAAATSMIDQLQNGVSQERAVLLGLGAGAAEVITEKIGLDNLFNSNWTGSRETFKSLARQIFSEGAEEGLSDVMNWTMDDLYDAITSQNQSAWHRAIEEYQKQGYTESEAMGLAMRDRMKELGMDMAGGALSGGLMGGGAAIGNNINFAASNSKTAGDVSTDTDSINALIESGLQAPEGSDSYKGAVKLQEQMAQGKAPSQRQILNQMYKNEMQISAEEEGLAPISERSGEELAQNLITGQETTTESTQEAQTQQTQEISAQPETSMPTAENVNTGDTEARPAAPLRGQQNNELPSWANNYIQKSTRTQFGANGNQVFESIAQRAEMEGINRVDALHEFKLAYNAGMNGTNLPEGLRLDARSVKLAQETGREAFLRQYKNPDGSFKSGFTSYRGKDAGINMDSDVVRKAVSDGLITEKQLKSYGALAKSLGVKVDLVETLPQNGSYHNGVITVALDAENGLAYTLSHELVHRLEKTAPEQYSALKSAIASAVGSEEISNALTRYYNLGQQQNVDLTQTGAMDEYVADWIADHVVKGDIVWNNFVESNAQTEEGRGILRSIRDVFHKLINQIKGVKDTDVQHLSDSLQKAQKLLDKTLAAAERNVKQNEKQSAEVNSEKQYSFKGYDPETGRGIYKSNFPKGTPRSAKAKVILDYIQNVWSKNPIDLVIEYENGTTRNIQAMFDPTYHTDGTPSDASKLMGGNRHGNATEKRVTLDLADDYYQLASEAKYNYSKRETGKDTITHQDVLEWHYFVNDIFFQEYDSDELIPYRVTINVKEKSNGDFVYSFNAEQEKNNEPSTPRTLHAVVNPVSETDETNARLLSMDKVTHDQEEGKQFSLKSSVEQSGNLVAVHNLTADKFMKSLDLGGLPMPSIAVTKSDIPHTNFGDISLVMNKSAIDPKHNRANEVYSADAWTPTVPQIDYEANPETERRLNNLYYDMAKKFGYDRMRPMQRLVNELEDVLSREDGVEGVIKKYQNDSDMKNIFLGDTTGSMIDAKEKTTETRMPEAEIKQAQQTIDILGEDQIKELADLQPMKRVPWLRENRERVQDMVRDVLLQRSGNKEVVDAFVERTKLNEMYLKVLRPAVLVYKGETVSTKTELDIEGQRAEIERATNEKEYKEWLNNLLSDAVKSTGIYNNKDPFTASGNRRSFKQLHNPVTLQGIVDAMKSQNGGNTKNVSGFYGVKTLRAGTARRFASISEMHEFEDRLQNLSKEEAEQINDALNTRLSELLNKIDDKKVHNTYDDIGFSHLGECLQEISENPPYSIDRIMKGFSQYGYSITSELAQETKELLFDISEMPVNIFEAKPQRAVGFNEILAAVVPTGMDEALLSKMREAGITNIIEYEAENNEDRLAKVNSVENAQFSLRHIVADDGTDYGVGVYLDSSLLTGLTPDERKQMVKLRVSELGGSTIVAFDQNGNKEYIHIANDNEKFYNKSGKKRSANHDLKSKNNKLPIKQETVVLADELIATSTYDTFKASKYPHGWMDNNGKNDWKYRKTYVIDRGNNIWEAVLNITTDSYGVEYLYDIDPINDMKKKGQAVKSASSPSVINLSQSGKNSNLQNSLRGGRAIVQASEMERQNRETTELLKKEVESLTGQVEYYKGQLKRSHGAVDLADANKRAKNLTKAWDSQIDYVEVGKQIKDMAELLNKNPERAWSDMSAQATDLAARMIKSSRTLVEDGDVFGELKKFVRKTPIHIYKNFRADIADWNNWRKSKMGRFTFVNEGGAYIEDMYHDLQSEWGTSLFPDINNEVDMLLYLDEQLDTYEPHYENMYAGEYEADAIESLKNEIISEVLDAAPVVTFADKAAKRQREAVRKAIQKTRDQKNQQIKRIRDQRDQKIEKIKQEHREVQERKRERQHDSADRTKLLKVMKRLDRISKKAGTATRELIQDLIGDYDLVAKSITGGKVEQLQDLSEYIDKMMEIDPNFMPSEKAVKDIARLGKKHISDMDIEDVRLLTEALLHLEHEIQNHNKLIDTNYSQDITEIGHQIYEDVMSTKGIGNSKVGVFNWFQQAYDKTIATPVIRPETEILRLVGFNRNSPLYQLTFGTEHSLASGQRDMVRYQWKANQTYFDKFLNDRAFVQEIMGKKAKEYTITGKKASGEVVTLSVTPDLLMALYMHSQNDQNFRHFGEWTDENGKLQHGDGVTIPDFNLYRKGKLEEAYRVAARDGNKIIMSKTALRSAMNQLSEKERSFIRAAQNYYSEMSQTEINRVSERLLGYGLAQVDNYFRINTDSDYRGTNMDAIKMDGTIEGMGFTKERTNARNAILLISLSEQLKRDIDAHSKYVGLAIPVRNFNKAFGVNRATVDEKGNWQGSEGSVQSAIHGKWGNGAQNYIQKLMSDIQNPKSSSDSWMKIFGKLRSHYAGSVLALNAGVAIKQAASYPTAAAEIGWAPLLKAFGNSSIAQANRLDMNIVNKYSPLMYLRTQGQGYQELADLKNLSSGWLNRALNSKALNWIQDMDVATVKKLWKAAEYYVRDNFKNLEIGTEEYYRKVGEIHSNIIERTQPNYTTLQRGEILRSDSDIVRTVLGMFKTQPFQNFSILFEGVGELRAASLAYKADPNVATKSARTAAVKKLSRAITSQLISSLVFALMQGAWDWLRGKDDKYKDEEGKITFGSFFKQLGINMGSNAFGMIPLGSVLYEGVEMGVDAIVENNGGEKIFDAIAYGADASTSTGIINDMQDALLKVVDLSFSFGSEDKPGTENTIRTLVDVGTKFMQAAGYPAGNFKRDIETVGVNLFRGLDKSGAMNEYEAEYYTKRMLGAVSSKTKSDYMDLLYRAYDNDKEAYNKLYNMYIENDGFATNSKSSKEYIDSKIETHEKESTKLKNRETAGLTEQNLQSYQEALDRYDDGNGSYTQEEVYNALMSINLSMKQKETLWSEHSSWKKSFSEYGASRK